MKQPRLAVKVTVISLAVFGALSAILVNFATAWKTNIWMWIGVAIVTAVSAVLSLLLMQNQKDTSPNLSGRQSQKSGGGSENYQAGRDISRGTEGRKDVPHAHKTRDDIFYMPVEQIQKSGRQSQNYQSGRDLEVNKIDEGNEAK